MGKREMNFQKASETDFRMIQKFYWDVTDHIHENKTKNEKLGWEKGVYPLEAYIQSSISKGLYTLTENDVLYVCVILDSNQSEGYEGCSWSILFDNSEVLIPHSLAVNPVF